MLTDLLAATHADGQPLSDDEIRDAIMTILIAGHDTTSIALAWALEQIVPRDDVVERIIAELQQVTGGAPPRADQLHQLEYLDAVIHESMRVRTIVPFVVRLTKRQFTAGGREYPPGVLLCPNSHLTHRQPDLYPEPEKFRPERFLERKYAAHEWFPFGGGNRMCVGMAFAMYEMKVVLGTLFATVQLARPAVRALQVGTPRHHLGPARRRANDRDAEDRIAPSQFGYISFMSSHSTPGGRRPLDVVRLGSAPGVTADIRLTIGAEPIALAITVPDGPTTLQSLLPIFHGFTNVVVDIARRASESRWQIHLMPRGLHGVLLSTDTSFGVGSALRSHSSSRQCPLTGRKLCGHGLQTRCEYSTRPACWTSFASKIPKSAHRLCRSRWSISRWELLARFSKAAVARSTPSGQ